MCGRLGFLAALACPLIGALAGCASIVDGSSQSLSVATTANGASLSGAECALTNNKGAWVVKTPGTFTVHRSFEALVLKCTDLGYDTATLSSGSSTKAMAFGNILFGGIVGVGVDAATGAAYDYPKLITVPLTPSTAALPQAAPIS